MAAQLQTQATALAHPGGREEVRDGGEHIRAAAAFFASHSCSWRADTFQLNVRRIWGKLGPVMSLRDGERFAPFNGLLPRRTAKSPV
jgi:hypothetical protein